MSSSRQIDLSAWQSQQIQEQIMRLEALLGGDAPQEDKARARKTLAYLNSPGSRRYITLRNKQIGLKKKEG
jgi:hypothetical protein